MAWGLWHQATNVKTSRLMKHRLVFLGGRSSVGIGNMLSASLRANKRGFDMEVLNIKSSNVKFSIGKMPSAWPRANKRCFDTEVLNMKNSKVKFSIGKMPTA